MRVVHRAREVDVAARPGRVGARQVDPALERVHRREPVRELVVHREPAGDHAPRIVAAEHSQRRAPAQRPTGDSLTAPDADAPRRRAARRYAPGPTPSTRVNAFMNAAGFW